MQGRINASKYIWANIVCNPQKGKTSQKRQSTFKRVTNDNKGTSTLILNNKLTTPWLQMLKTTRQTIIHNTQRHNSKIVL